MLPHFLGWGLLAVAAGGLCYAAVAVVMAGVMLRKGAHAPIQPFPAITVLKPLHGAEPGLEAALGSFLNQDYPMPVQVVFGVRDPLDAALPVVEKLRARFPQSDIEVVIDSRLYGTNMKISNVINATRKAKHDLLLLADSDITVPQNYLTAIASACAQPGVGAVSCLYSGRATDNLWSQIVAMGTNYQFLPNAAFGISAGLVKPCFGSTIALRRETLDKIGGFEAFASQFADDFEIGRAVCNAGYDIAYPALAVQHGNAESTLSELMRHELRWARTVRMLNPTGHLGSLVTHPLPLALLGAALLGFSHTAVMVFCLLLAVRIGLKLAMDAIVGSEAGSSWLIPLRDALSMGVFLGSLFGNAVEWRGQRLRIDRTGAIQEA